MIAPIRQSEKSLRLVKPRVSLGPILGQPTVLKSSTGMISKIRSKGRCRRRSSQGRVLATETRRCTGFIRATPLSEDPRSVASRLIARPERSTQIL
jgi:hypothetical protein